MLAAIGFCKLAHDQLILNYEHQAENIKIIAVPACERCCNINLHQRIGINQSFLYMCLACHGAQYAGRNRLQFYVATYMHITNLKALGKKPSKSLHQLTSTHWQCPRVSVNVFSLPWSAVCLPQLASIVCCNIHAHDYIKSIRQKHQNHCNACV